VLLILDAMCVMHASAVRLSDAVRSMSPSDAQGNSESLHAPQIIGEKESLATPTVSAEQKTASQQQQLYREMSKAGTELHFSQAHVNVDNIKMRVFEKKIN
jgi:enterochelin esterase-like enzyme